MPFRLLCFSIGVITVSFLPQLPPLFTVFVALPIILLASRYLRGSWMVALLLGLAWGVYSGQQLLKAQLHESLVGADLQVTGIVSDLPDINDRRLRFNLSIRHALNTHGESIALSGFPGKIQLSWYQDWRKQQGGALPEIRVGQAWQLTVRLKRPRGFANPAGFDYQAWLLRQGIGATGYVLNTGENIALDQALFFSAINWREWVDLQRQRLQQWILDHSDSLERGILIALLIGDSAHVEKEQWSRMQQTGTSHLIAISGLHVGFLALFGFYVGLFIGKCIQLLWRPCPALVIAWLMATLCAAFYSALAGFNIPTVRTLIMIGLFYWACLARRSLRISDIFCCALALVVIIDPLAAYDMGFWLSFGAVALLLFYFSGRRVIKTDADYGQGFSWWQMIIGFIRSQWVMFIGLLIPLSVLVNSVSLVAPLANAIAIPLITFFIVPLLLIAAALRDWLPMLSDPLLGIAATALEWLAIILQTLLNIAGDYASPVVAFPSSIALLIAVSCLVLLMPKGLLPRAIGWSGLLLGVFLTNVVPAMHVPELKLSIMDVGQGTAVVIQVKDKTLVYDTGPRYTESFDAGSAILAPYLFSQAISTTDLLVISHNDMDHAGGADNFLNKINARKIVVGDIENTRVRVATPTTIENCHQLPPWQWYQVSFEFLPVTVTRATSDNNKSCVLLIRYRGQTILLPGDIETHVENPLIAQGKIPSQLTLLLAAHHGSRTSSGEKWVRYTKPTYVVYSAGYRSQHGHPHPHVRRRFQAVGSREFNTAESGALIFEWFETEPVKIIEYRKAHHRYWFD